MDTLGLCFNTPHSVVLMTDIGTSHFSHYVIFFFFKLWCRQATYFNCSKVNCDWNRHAGTIGHMFYWGHQLNLIQEQHVSINGTAAWPNTVLHDSDTRISCCTFSFPSCTETILMTKYKIIFSLFEKSLQDQY